MNSLCLRAGRGVFRLLGLTRESAMSKIAPAPCLSPESGNSLIRSALTAGQPSLVCRLGTPEANATLNILEIARCQTGSPISRLYGRLLSLREAWDPNVGTALQDLVGFFPADFGHVEKFVEHFTADLSLADSVGFWGWVPGESYLLKKYCPEAKLFAAQALEPYLFDQPWSAGLSEKRVLVIHPFAASIQAQYAHRNQLFENPDVLPSFQLRTLKAVQSLAGTPTPFKSWFEALDSMKREMESSDFDICLVGAGSYGLPLCAHAKRLGKVAVQIGGGLQILFGIKGKRWEGMPHISRFFNSNWIRPGETERIPSAEKIEGGCYW